MKLHASLAILALAAQAAFCQGLVSTTSPASPATLESGCWGALKEGLVDNDLEHRKQAIRALGTIGARADAVHLVEWALGDGNWVVREAVPKAVGERGNKNSIPPLEALLCDDHRAVRYMAAASIIRLSDRNEAN